jgi:hypothetical protein
MPAAIVMDPSTTEGFSYSICYLWISYHGELIGQLTDEKPPPTSYAIPSRHC